MFWSTDHEHRLAGEAWGGGKQVNGDYAADLYCGLGGWAEGFLAEGIKVIGFDVERHDYGTGGYPGQLILQDVLSLHGSQLKDALCLVASPPCTEYSYMAMPWQRAKQIAGALREEVPFPKDYKGSRTIEQLNALFNACFRLQREASEAAGRHIPLIVENVKGAQPWVGRAQANFGSFYLWGDVGMAGNRVIVLNGPLCDAGLRPRSRAQKVNPDGTGHPQGSWFAIANSKNRGAKSAGQDWSRFAKTGEVSPHWRMEATKNDGGSWFNIAHNATSGVGRNPVEKFAGIKNENGGEGGWFGSYSEQKARGTISPGRMHSSHSSQRKAASAQIAKIPFPLANYIARSFKPHDFSWLTRRVGGDMKQTEAQILLKVHLAELGIKTVAEYRFDAKRNFRFDLAALEEQFGFECNGHWQGKHGSGWSGDFEKFNLAQAQGWKVFVFHNRDVLTGKAKEFMQKVLQEALLQP